MSKRLIVFVIGIVLIVILAFVFFNNYSNRTLEVDETKESNVQLTGETKEFTIVASKFKFEPREIEVNLGDKVQITAYSFDVPHGFALPEFKVNLYLENEPKSIEFIADKKGEFQYFCNTFCGDGHGEMKGRLIVN